MSARSFPPRHGASSTSRTLRGRSAARLPSKSTTTSWTKAFRWRGCRSRRASASTRYRQPSSSEQPERMMNADQVDPVVKEYSDTAKNYDKKWAFYVEATTRETLARLRILPTDRVLDVGCGTGELLARLAAKYPEARLAGLDPVPEMLEVAWSLRTGATTTWRAASATSISGLRARRTTRRIGKRNARRC